MLGLGNLVATAICAPADRPHALGVVVEAVVVATGLVATQAGAAGAAASLGTALLPARRVVLLCTIEEQNMARNIQS